MEIVNRDEVHPKIIEALLKADTGLSLDDHLENEMILN
ncbi:MAG: hypothetical protein H6Q27_1398, partial [Ignavibacteriaceae bacterium]|nr:hypothetical protein [Ignavibacteriaceae bacterium]